MGTRLKARRMFAQQCAAGADQVVAGAFVPAFSTILGVNGYINFEASVERGLNEVALGAAAAYVLPVTDPDSASTMQVLWDTGVPKDRTDDILNLDTASQVTTPFWEPGMVRWEEVFEVGASPIKLFESHFMSRMGHNAIAVNRDPETAFDYEYIGGKFMAVRLNGPMRVTLPSLVVVGIGSPLTTGTSATAAVAGIAEEDWAQLQFIDNVMERAMLHVLGLTETTAETPWEEATALLQRHLDPAVFEIAGGIFQPTTWNVSGEMHFDMEVQGSIPKGKVIDLGG